MYSIKELYMQSLHDDSIHVEDRALFRNAFTALPDEINDFYSEHYKRLDENFVRMYRNYKYMFRIARNGDEYIPPRFSELEYTLYMFRKHVHAMTVLNQYKYTTLFNSMFLSYDPIENYNRTERIETEYFGEELSENVKSGNATDNVTYTGSEKETLTKSGSEKDTLTKSGTESKAIVKTGVETDTESLGAKHSTSQRDVSADDVSTYSPDTRSIDDVTASTNSRTLSFENRSDNETTSFSNRKDENEKTFTNRKDENEKTFTNRADNRTTTYNDVTDSTKKSFDSRKDVTVNTTKGNIGVTTSQQMLQSERDIAMFSFWQILFSDIANELLLLVDYDVTESDYIMSVEEFRL